MNEPFDDTNIKPCWAKQLKRRGDYYKGLVDSDDLGSILEAHRRSTITSYGTRTSSKLDSSNLGEAGKTTMIVPFITK